MYAVRFAYVLCEQIPRFDSSGKLSPDVATFVKNVEKSLSWDKVFEETKGRIKGEWLDVLRILRSDFSLTSEFGRYFCRAFDDCGSRGQGLGGCL